MENAIERNADTIAITCLVVVDLMASTLALQHSIFAVEAINTSVPGLPTYTLFIDIRLFTGIIMIKSVFLFITAFLIASRITNRPPRHTG